MSRRNFVLVFYLKIKKFINIYMVSQTTEERKIFLSEKKRGQKYDLMKQPKEI